MAIFDKKTDKFLKEQFDWLERHQKEIEKNAIDKEIILNNSLQELYENYNCKYFEVDDEYIFINIKRLFRKGGKPYYTAIGLNFRDFLEDNNLILESE